MILLAKFLPQELISVYEAFWFTASMLTFFWVSSCINAALTWIPKLSETDKRKAYFNIFLLFTAVSAVISLLLYAAGDWFNETFGAGGELSFAPLLSVFLLFQTPAWLVQVFYLLLKKYREIYWFGTLTFGLQIAAVIVPLWYGRGLEAVFWGLIMTAGVKFIWLLVLLVRHAHWRADGRLLTPLLLLSLPLVLKSFLGHGYEYIDGFIVKAHFTDENAFAVFRYGAREMPYIALFVGAIVMAVLPVMSENSESGMRELKQKTLQLARWMFPVSSLLMVVSPWLFASVFNPEFRDSAYVFNVYLLMLSSRLLLPQTIIMAKEENYFLLVSAVIEITVNIVLSLLLVRIFGLSGIAFASVIAFYVNKINQMIWLQVRHNISPAHYVAWRPHLLFSLLLYGCFAISLSLHGII